MPQTRSLDVKNGDVLVLVGTTKGAFVLRSRGGARSRWDLGGPHFPGQQIYSLALDARGSRPRLWAGGSSDHWGPVLHSSDDFGKSWSNPEQAPLKFPEDTGASLKRVWQLVPGPERDVLYAGVEPAALFVSRDAGQTWELERSLWEHPHRPRWQPGGGGMCLHTVLPDPTDSDRVTVAVSAAGVYRTEDGGASWQSRNQGIRAEFLPEEQRYPEFGQCVHKIVHHPSRPDRMFLQNHWGLYRSDNGGGSWQDIANGVPSDFGFAMAMHPHDPDTVYIVPIESDMFRCTPDGKLRVYRTRDAGKSWEPLTRGLPQKDALECILRDAMDTDDLNPAGVYFGTRSGSVWGSPDGGASWTEIASNLPPVVCVKTAFVGDPSRVRAGAKGAARAASKPARKGAKKSARAGAARTAGKVARKGAKKTARPRAKASASRARPGKAKVRARTSRARTAPSRPRKKR